MRPPYIPASYFSTMRLLLLLIGGLGAAGCGALTDQDMDHASLTGSTLAGNPGHRQHGSSFGYSPCDVPGDPYASLGCDDTAVADPYATVTDPYGASPAAPFCAGAPYPQRISAAGPDGHGSSHLGVSTSGHFPMLSDDGRVATYFTHLHPLTPGQETAIVHDTETASSAAVTPGLASRPTGISGDGRYVVLMSKEALLPDDTNGTHDVYLFDRQTGSFALVSVSTGGSIGNTMSWDGVTNTDGRYVAFLSDASNLVPNDTAGYTDIFVRDVHAGTTTRVHVRSDGAQAKGFAISGLGLSADGRYVAFTSYAGNLVDNDITPQAYDAYVHDRHTGTTRLVSVNSAGEQGDEVSFARGISADGRYVTFTSFARNLDPGPHPGLPTYPQAYVHDLTNGTTHLISMNSTGDAAATGAWARNTSADGRYVLFSSHASNLSTKDQWGSDGYVHDRLTGQTALATTDCLGDRIPHVTRPATLSADGRFLVFETPAPLDAGTTGGWNVYLAPNPLW